MMYKIMLTDNALTQLRESVSYISKVLFEPKIARDWSERIKKEILSLDHMPFRYPLVEEEPWRSKGIHKMTVENFIVYYWVNDETSIVWVLAVIYGRKDQTSALRNIPNDS